MGWLVKMAGLDYLYPEKEEVLLALLMDAKLQIDLDPNIASVWREIGRKAFDLRQQEKIENIKNNEYYLEDERLQTKAEKRLSIIQGGLIVKAGLSYLHPKQANVLLGLLIDAKSQLDTDPLLEFKWQTFN